MSQALLDLLLRRWKADPAILPPLRRLVEAWEAGHTGVLVDAQEAPLLMASLAVDADGADKGRPLTLAGGLLQSRLHFEAELEVAGALRALAAASPAEAPSPGAWRAWESLYPDPRDSQGRAARLGMERSLAMITGGPGTGKTHTAARILGLLLEDRPGLRFALAAPTGKAAQRLGESVAAAAGDARLKEILPQGAALLAGAAGASATLHRLLEWRPGEDRCGRNAEKPLELDVLVVDEAGMLDLLLWRALLRALPRPCRLLVLGDPFQLESIEPGRVLGALAEAAGPAGALHGCLVELTRNHRFERHPGIGALAAALRGHDAAALLAAAPLDAAKDAEVQRVEGPDLDRALDKVWPQVLALARAKEAAPALEALADLRVLCLLNEGPWGVRGLNQRISARLAREGIPRPAYPVLVTVNDPHSGLFNGDLGVLLPSPEGDRAVFPGAGGGRNFPAAQVPEGSEAWAITVHRSQGSEYDTVLLVLPQDAQAWAGPELLYTAVTRARERVVLAASDAALAAGCEAKPVRMNSLGRLLY